MARTLASRCFASSRGSSYWARSHHTVAFCLRSRATWEGRWTRSFGCASARRGGPARPASAFEAIESRALFGVAREGESWRWAERGDQTRMCGRRDKWAGWPTGWALSRRVELSAPSRSARGVRWSSSAASCGAVQFTAAALRYEIATRFSGCPVRDLRKNCGLPLGSAAVVAVAGAAVVLSEGKRKLRGRAAVPQVVIQ